MLRPGRGMTIAGCFLPRHFARAQSNNLYAFMMLVIAALIDTTASDRSISPTDGIESKHCRNDMYGKKPRYYRVIDNLIRVLYLQYQTCYILIASSTNQIKEETI